MTAFYERRRERQEKKQESKRHSEALAKYEKSLEKEGKLDGPSSLNSPPSMTVAALRSQSFAGSNDTEGKESKKTSLLNVSTTQAYVLVGLFIFLLIVALIIFGLSYVANMMMEMQRKHEEQIIELKRQNTLQMQENGMVQINSAGNIEIPLEGMSRNKIEAYGRFEDEINMSNGDFETTSRNAE